MHVKNELILDKVTFDMTSNIVSLTQGKFPLVI